MTQFHSLAIDDIRQETADCVSISFSVPDHLQDDYRFQAGQNITLRLLVNGEELRRSYSICSSPLEQELRIAIKKVAAGRFSTHANHQLKKGDKIDVLPPTGKFSIPSVQQDAANFVAFAAGSGITPVLSILKTVLAGNPQSTFTLIYGNRSRSSIIFREQLEGLKNKYMDRLAIHHVFSREVTDAVVNQGRIDEGKCEQLVPWLFRPEKIDHAFLCGPRDMIFGIMNWLLEKGLDRSRIHFELFAVPVQRMNLPHAAVAAGGDTMSDIVLTVDAAVYTFRLAKDSTSILEAALLHGVDLPFSCKGGVCATCRAKLVEGEVEMDSNYALEPEELKKGFILTCQSHPVTDKVVIDFDAR